MTENNLSRIQEILVKTNLDWTVRKESVQTESGIIIPKTLAIVRDDNNTPLAIHKDGYYAYQNYQMVELLDKISNQTGLPIHSGGFFRDGARIYLQLKSDSLALGNDRIDGFITGINSFDGSTSLAFGPSSITISCMNTFFAAFRSIETKIRHTKNMEIRIDDVLFGLDIAQKQEKTLFNNIVKLSEAPMEQKDIEWAARILFDIEKEIGLKDDDLLSSTKRNKLSKFYIDVAGEIKDKDETLWGLFSGITKYTSHSLNEKKDSTENKMFGIYGSRERAIFNKLVERVN